MFVPWHKLVTPHVVCAGGLQGHTTCLRFQAHGVLRLQMYTADKGVGADCRQADPQTPRGSVHQRS